MSFFWLVAGPLLSFIVYLLFQMLVELLHLFGYAVAELVRNGHWQKHHGFPFRLYVKKLYFWSLHGGWGMHKTGLPPLEKLHFRWPGTLCALFTCCCTFRSLFLISCLQHATQSMQIERILAFQAARVSKWWTKYITGPGLQIHQMGAVLCSVHICGHSPQMRKTSLLGYL